MKKSDPNYPLDAVDILKNRLQDNKVTSDFLGEPDTVIVIDNDLAVELIETIQSLRDQLAAVNKPEEIKKRFQQLIGAINPDLSCNHEYSRTMNQEYPRKCVKCGKPEGLASVRY